MSTEWPDAQLSPLARHPEGGQTHIALPCLTRKRTVDVDRLGGRRTVMNLWASWCTVCRQEMPVLESAYRARDGEVQFLGVDTLDETGPAADFRRRTAVSYPKLYDQQANC
jgi:thiol-disulfide isomerase/thioredoxin